MYETSLKVRFGDEDHARIAYFPRIVHFFHCAFEDFFDDHGHPYRKVLDEDGYGWPAVGLNVDFMRPIRFGEILKIQVWVERLGSKSATFGYRAHLAGKTAALAQVTVACIGMESFGAVEIPEPYRSLFAEHLQPGHSESLKER